jgi:hypothetical protein
VRHLAFAALVVAAFVTPSRGADTIASVYTPLDLDKCRHVAGTMEEDYGEWRCQGYGGIPVFVSAGDQRSFVSYGRSAKNEPAARQTLASFNGEGKTIEWRGVRGADGTLKPFATIMRWSTTKSGEEPPMHGQVLVVTRLGQPVCHVGYVDARANTDANALAQKIADEEARKFQCGADKPVVLGIKGPGFSGPADE